MIVDLKGLRNPEHIRKFREHFEGICAVYEDIEVYLDDVNDDLKRFEMYIRTCRAKYEVHREQGHLRVHIFAPFNMCG
jgi:predicted  nucleic acid-binding Zn-ribbon protein